MADAPVLVIVLRLAGATLVIVALMLLAAKATRRMNGTARTMDRSALSVVSRHPLNKSASVALIRAGSKTLVVGVTDHSVTLLSELSTMQPTVLDNDPAASGPAHLLRLDRTVPDRVHRVSGARIDAIAGTMNDVMPGTASRGVGRPSPPRTNLVETLRNRTVRRS